MRFVPVSIERTAWVDCCKGICIVLVVYGHIAGGLAASGTLKQESFWMALRDWVYLFHMPAFFVLSGMFAASGINLSARDFVVRKLRTIFYPYVVWTGIIVGAQFVMARFVNNPPDLNRALHFLIEPYGYGLWFLYSLFIVSLLYYVLARFRIPASLIVLIAGVLSLMASFNVFNLWPIFNTSMSFFIFYVAAACIRKPIFSLFSNNGPIVSIIYGIVLLLIMTIVLRTGWNRMWLLNLLLAALGIFGVICLAKGMAQTVGVRCCALLGVFSLEIYLGHPLWGTVSRVFLVKSGINNPPAMVLGGVLLGIGGSLIIGVLCRDWKFPYLFRWPAKIRADH